MNGDVVFTTGDANVLVAASGVEASVENGVKPPAEKMSTGNSRVWPRSMLGSDQDNVPSDSPWVYPGTKRWSVEETSGVLNVSVMPHRGWVMVIPPAMPT